MQVGRDGLRDLEAEADAHTEQVVGTEALDRILTGERLVGGFHADCPPSTGALGVVGEDGEEEDEVGDEDEDSGEDNEDSNEEDVEDDEDERETI